MRRGLILFLATFGVSLGCGEGGDDDADGGSSGSDGASDSGSATTGDDGTTGDAGSGSATGSGGETTTGTVAPTTFEIVLENVSAPWPTSGGDIELMFAPGVWAIHGDVEPIFTAGEADRGEGLEALAEDGDPMGLGATLAAAADVNETAIFEWPEGSYEAAAIKPGERFVFEVSARPGERLSFAGMFVQSNDLFLAPRANGVALFDDQGDAISGDLTAELTMWDAGTEVNEEPGVGDNQAPRQPMPNTGPDEDGVVQDVADADDGFTYPTTGEFVTLTITPL